MTPRSVPLDAETEKWLTEVCVRTGMRASDVIKSGVRLLRQQLRQTPERSAYAIYKHMDLGSGGYAVSSSATTRRGVRRDLRRKLDK